MLLPFMVSAQTTSEKKDLKKAVDPAAESRLISFLQEQTEKNKSEIAAYLATHPDTPNQENIQFIEDGKPVYYGVDNVNSVATLRGSSLYPAGTLGANATGSGILVGVWDSERVRDTHQEFGGRVTVSDAATTNNTHATHVTGTILASGVNATRKGFAYQANAVTYDFSGDTAEMQGQANQGLLVSNHSYGLIAGNLSQYVFGNYSSQSVSADLLMNTYPYYQIVKAAGNDRSDTAINQVVIKQGYDLLTGFACAKNVLTIGAVNQVSNYVDAGSVEMSSFSNYGPPDDGRVKPDLVAMGVGVSSCSATTNAGYTILNGTSMATPAVTGLIALLQDHYNNLNPGTYMRSSSVRAVLIHSAREAGNNPGPDYEFGWGLPDGYEAGRIISGKGNTTVLDERTLTNGSVYTANFTVNSAQNLRVTLAWTDPAGTSNGTADDDRTPRLINNLDLKVIKDGTTYYPWKLDPNVVFAGATNNSDNDVDNVERIDIENAQPGVYTIQISHKGSLSGGSQIYSLVASADGQLTVGGNQLADNDFFAYPVPAKDQLHFTNLSNSAIESIEITDISGKIVGSFSNVSDATINIQHLQSGVYFAKITADSKAIVRKFVKE